MNKVIMTLISLIALIGFASSASVMSSFQNATIVIGSQDDMEAAQNLRDFLTGGVSGNNASESFLFSRSSNKLNLGENLTSVQTGVIDNSELPTLLARGQYESQNGDTYNYDQEIVMGSNLLFTVFQNNDYNNGDPSIGIFIRDGQHILNYTLDFTDPVQSDISNGALTNLENTQIQLLGRQYTIITASSDNTIEMLSGAEEGSLNLNETSTFVVNGQEFTVNAVFINANEARFRVNGQLTNALNEGDTAEIGGTTIAVTAIDYQDFAGGVQRVQFLIGASKLILRDGQEVEFAGENIDGVTSYIDSSISGNQYTLRSITIQWNANENLFVAQNVSGEHAASLPALGNLSLVMTDFVTSSQEEFQVRSNGNDVIAINAFVKDSGDTPFELPILYSNGNDFTEIGGGDNNDLLATSSSDTITWNDNVDEYLVASWDEENAAESYILSLNIGTNEGEDVVTFRNLVTNSNEEDNIRVGDVARFGQIEITVDSINKSNDTAVLTINSGASFNHLYTQEGLKVDLPTPDNVSLGSATQYTLNLTEADKDGNIGKGQSFGILVRVNPSTNEVEVGSVQNTSVMAGGILSSLENDSDILHGWIQSPLASEIRIDTAGQGTATVFYHGSESYGLVYLTTSPNLTVGNDSVDIMFVSDIENVTGNLIVLGGTCVNNLSAQLLNVSFPTCGDAWENETGVGLGEFLINTFASPFDNSSLATLVAGYERADTLDGVQYLMNNSVDISEGNEIIR